MSRYYAKSRPRLIGRRMEAIVVDRERTNDRNGSLLVVVNTSSDAPLAHRIAQLLNRKQIDGQLGAAGNFRAERKASGNFFSGHGACLMRRHEEKAATLDVGGRRGAHVRWRVAATVDNLALAEQIAGLLNAAGD